MQLTHRPAVPTVVAVCTAMEGPSLMGMSRRALLVTAGVLTATASARASGKPLPALADPAFRRFWGTWEGEAEDGTHVVLDAVDAEPDVLWFRITQYNLSKLRGGPADLMKPLAFERDGSGERLYWKPEARAKPLYIVKALPDGALTFVAIGISGSNHYGFTARLERRP